MRVTGKLAVVTGGARRLGRAIVEALAAAGALPVIHYHQSSEKAEQLAAELHGWAIGADLSRPEGAEQLARAVAALPGELAVWVNSASLLERVAFLEADEALWQRTLQLTLLSPAACCRQIAPRMVAGGVIVNILDVAAQQPLAGLAHLCAAKAGLLMLTRALAAELGPRLRVCGVTPGVVLPPDDQPEAWSSLVRRIPLQRQGCPADVAGAVRYLVEADYVTGSVITVDGGLLARAPA